MKSKLTAMEAIRAWLSWLFLWLAWAITTTFGWFLAWLWLVGMGAAYAIPPESVISPSERLSDSLFMGAVVGVIPGVVVGLLLWGVLRRSPRDAIWAVPAVVGGSALLCASLNSGPQFLGISGGVLGGGFAGICQWAILRRKASKIDAWTGLTVAGWVAGLTITFLAVAALGVFSWARPLGLTISIEYEQVVSNQMLSLAILAIGGAIVGLVQWPLLRHNVKQAGWWILATAIGWVILGGAGLGVITGTALVLLLYLAPRGPQPTAA